MPTATKQYTGVRWMIRRDLPAVLEMEAIEYGEDATTEAEFLQLLSSRSCIAVVAEVADRVVGYAVYELERGALVMIAFLVHPNFRRQGVGRQILDHIRRKLSAQRRASLWVHVRERNLGAQLFLRAAGLRCVRVDRHSDADTYVFLARANH